jgi:hypothetical protein
MFDFDYILERVGGTLVELNKQVGGFQAVTSTKLTCNHNKVSELELKLSSSLTFSVGIGDTTTARGKKYVCLSNWTEHNAVKETGGDYVIIFFSPEGWMIKANLYHCVETLTEGVYSWSRDNEKVEVGSLKTFGEFLCYNTNLQQGRRIFKLGTFPEGMDSEYKVISFSADNCLSCLYDICTAYGVRYEVVENPNEDSDYILNFSNTDVIFPYDFTYEKQGGLYSLKINNADEEVYTEFVVKGSEDNLPLEYPHNELWLDETLYPLSTIRLTDKYARWGKSIKEIKLDIKPERVGVVSGVYEDLNSFEDEDLIGATWSPVGGTISVVEGPLAGFDFTVSGFDSTTGKVTVEQNTENERLPLPSGSYYLFTIETKYTITGIPLPQSYLTAAQEKMLTEAFPQVDWYGQLRCGVEIGVSPFLMQDLETELEAGQLLHISKSADEIDKYLRIQSIQYDLSQKRYFNVSQLAVSDFRGETLDDKRYKAYKMAVQAHEIATKKQKKGDPGEDGQDAITVNIWSDNGNAFTNGAISTTLRVYVYKGIEDITDTIAANLFSWVRTSNNPDSDLIWNNAHKSIGSTLSITADDVTRSAIFSVEVTIDDTIYT